MPGIPEGGVSPIQPNHWEDIKVAHFINPITRRSDEEKLKQCIPINHVREVCKIPISMTGGNDKLIWRVAKSGSYTVKSGYALQISKAHEVITSKPSCSFTPSNLIWRKFWSIPTLCKIRLFMWKALRNWVACRANLVRRKCGVCPICELASETIEHLLFHCPWSKAVWFASNKAYWIFRKEVVAVDK